ncbi:MAG: RNA polymerase subunit sigma-70 [Bacteroidales bacterium]|nr:RNA polymerase subunit sigma-70 [Bacteroidales bacterium]
MDQAVISGDIIASTGLSNDGRDYIEQKLNELIAEINREYILYGRLLKGDYLECVVTAPQNALLVALLIKSYVKSFSDNEKLKDTRNKRFRLFRTYGIRVAIGFGELGRFDASRGIIDGEAIYLSGRKINEEATYNKERITIRNSLFFISKYDELNNELEPLISLIDTLISKATPRQCEILYYKLRSYTEEAISKKLSIAQSAVNQHSTGMGWNAVEKAVKRFNQVIQNHLQ